MANGNAPKMTAEDKAWMAKEDARTLAEAETIKGDKSRMGAAKQAAASMADEAKKRADAMTVVANGSMGMMNGKSGPSPAPVKKKGSKVGPKNGTKGKAPVKGK